MSDTTEKLLPCPFCGHAADGDWAGEFAVMCKNCPAEIQDETEEHAVAAWNRRVAEEPKWTEEPSEDGMYLVKLRWLVFCHVRQGTVGFIPTHPLGKKISMEYREIDEIKELYPEARWLKIDIPALPEEEAPHDE